jgi:periplasmic protein TonB
VTDMTLLEMGGGASGDARPLLVRPKWLRPTTLAAVLAMHAAVVLVFLWQPVRPLDSLEGVSVDLEQGDADVTQEEIDKVDVQPLDMADDPLAAPPPLVMAPEAPPLPIQRKPDAVKKPVVKPREEREPSHTTASQRQTTRGANVRGHGEGKPAASLRAAFLRSIMTQLAIHRPRDLPSGMTTVCFNVSAGGGVSVGSASGPGAAAGRRAVASIHPGRDASGQGFHGCQNFHAQ